MTFFGDSGRITAYPDITQLRNMRLRTAIYSNLISAVPPGLLLLDSNFPKTIVLGYSRLSLREKEAARRLVVRMWFPPDPLIAMKLR
jgi:hypothetical protein